LSNCLSCLNSACCSTFDVEVSKREYEKYDIILQSKFLKKSEQVLKNSKYHCLSAERRERFVAFIDNEAGESFAKLKKGQSGNCVLLDEKTMLCSIYEKRPKVCEQFTENRCVKIRVLKNDN